MVKSILLGKYCFNFVNTSIVLDILFAILLVLLFQLRANIPRKLKLSTQSTFVLFISMDGMSIFLLGEWNNINFDLFALRHSLLTCSHYEILKRSLFMF